MLKVTPDTNILVSAFLKETGNEWVILNMAKEDRIKLIISQDILNEFNDIIKRDKFGFSRKQIVNFNTQLVLISEFAEPKEKITAVKDDPDDDIILEAAVEGKVDYLVSGDKHLLDLKKFRGIKIVNAGEFLKSFNNLK